MCSEPGRKRPGKHTRKHCVHLKIKWNAPLNVGKSQRRQPAIEKKGAVTQHVDMPTLRGAFCYTDAQTMHTQTHADFTTKFPLLLQEWPD